jgi:hypothetical protein
MTRLLALSFLLMIFFVSNAQVKNIVTNEQLWFGYFNQTRLTDRSGIWLDPQLRLTENFVDRASISILRAGYIYFLNDNVRLTAGYGYITAYSGSDEVPNIPEHRPWQQIQWFDKRKHFTMMQYVRLEERFRRKSIGTELLDDYLFTYRFRYNIAFTIPLKAGGVQPKTPFAFVNNEILINAGKEVVNNYFDQNRFFAGVGYQFTKSLNAQIGYLNVFVAQPVPYTFTNAHAVRVFVFHNLDLRKEK